MASPAPTPIGRAFSALPVGGFGGKSAERKLVLDMIETEETKSRIESIFGLVDVDSSGAIEWADFVAMMGGDRKMASARYRRVFEWLLLTFDSDDDGRRLAGAGDGKITLEEFRTCFLRQALSVLHGRIKEEINHSIMEKVEWVKKVMAEEASVLIEASFGHSPLIRFCMAHGLNLSLADTLLALLPSEYSLNVPEGQESDDLAAITAHEEDIMKKIKNKLKPGTLNWNRLLEKASTESSTSTEYVAAEVTSLRVALDAWSPSTLAFALASDMPPEIEARALAVNEWAPASGLRPFSEVAAGAEEWSPAQKSAISIVVDNMIITEATKGEITALFKSIDVTGDGAIDVSDVIMMAQAKPASASAAGLDLLANAKTHLHLQWLLSTFDSPSVTVGGGGNDDGKISADEFYARFQAQGISVMLGRGAVEINRSIMEKCARIEHLFSLSSEISEVTMLIPDNSPLIRWMKEKGLPVSIAYEIFNVPEIPYDCSLNLPNKTPEEELSDPDKIAAHEKWVMDVVETYYVQIQQHLKTHAVSADEADSGDMDYTAADVVTFQMKFEDW